MTEPRRIDAYFIQASEPNKSGYTCTITVGVVATDIEDAIAAFNAAHPTATLWGINHRGRIEVITSPARQLENPTND